MKSARRLASKPRHTRSASSPSLPQRNVRQDDRLPMIVIPSKWMLMERSRLPRSRRPFQKVVTICIPARLFAAKRKVERPICGDPFAYLEQVKQHISRLPPALDPNARNLPICGYPNVGKSSCINKVTIADLDVQPYAFTTKSLFVGHLR
jgi:ribosome biogenesis GTPase A